MGLAICGKLVRTMGGRMWLESPWPGAAGTGGGPGSAFHFSAVFGWNAAAPARSTDALRGAAVLVADDNAISREVITRILSSHGAAVVGVDSGEAVLDAARRAADAGSPFTIVVLDHDMPGVDGLEAAARLQGAGFEMPVLLMGSGGPPSHDRRRRQIRIHAHLMKPARESELVETVASLREQRRAVEGPVVRTAKPATPRASHPLRILVCEDNPVNQKLIRLVLEAQGHRVEVAGNGKAGLELAAAHPFDLIFMDVQMPEMDGFEATAGIRALERALNHGRHTPILAMTAHAMKGDRERCLEAGMDGYVSKPATPTEIHDAIEAATAAPQ
jgi:CheY-like chemotaxis protein